MIEAQTSRARKQPGIVVRGARPMKLKRESSLNRIPYRYAPLIAWLSISLLSIYCFIDGPFTFRYRDSTLLYIYLAAVHAAIIIGYWRGVRRYKQSNTKVVDRETLIRIVRLLAWVAIAGLTLGVYQAFTSPVSIYDAINDPFIAREAWIGASGSSWRGYVGLFLSISYFPLIASTFAYWSYLPRTLRWQAFLILAAAILGAIQGGSRHGIFAMLVAATAAVFAGSIARRFPLRPKVLFLVVLGGVFLFTLYSSFITVSRTINRVADYGDFLRAQKEFLVDPENFWFDFLPKGIEPAVLSGFFYFGHGYEGLAASLEKPFIGIGFGAGHSRVIIRNVAKILGDDVLRFSYFDRLIMEDGWSGSLWVTIYPWLASDVTFPGSVLVIGFLAWILANTWQETIAGRGLYAPWILVWVFYTAASTSSILPGGDYGSLIGYWGSGLLWWRSRRSNGNAMPRRRVR